MATSAKGGRKGLCGGCWEAFFGGSSSRRKEKKNAAKSTAKAPKAVEEAQKREVVKVRLGELDVKVETWPSFRLGSIVWPSGMLLARALAEGLPGLPKVEGRRVVEIGAGPGLPALTAGLLDAAEVVITDKEDLVPLMDRNIEINGLASTCRAEALDWDLAAESALATSSRSSRGEAPIDVLLGADVVYFEEQDPLVEAIQSLMTPGHTTMVLAYRERTPADRMYLNDVLLKILDCQRIDFSTADAGCTEIYVGKLRST